MPWSRLASDRPDPVLLDGIVALLAFVAIELQLALGSNIDGPMAVNIVAGALVTLPVALRRRWPLGVAVVLGVALAAQEALDGDVTENTIVPLITFPMAAYSIATLCDRRRAIGGLVAMLALVWTDALLSDNSDTSDFLFTGLLIGGPWLVGRIVEARVMLAAELRDKADRLEREQAKQAELAVAQERSRIARELHDVVAHNVSVMVVQAAAARRMIDHDPARAVEALGSVEQTGREALKEMRRMVGMLGQADEELALAPQPSVSELDWLVDRARQAGLEVDLTIEGEKKRLESSVDLSAFRIVQEALRNTLKHAGPATARVTLRYGEHDVEVDVCDNGRGAPSSADLNGGPGQGLVGMRERVAMLGGEIEAGYRKDGGFGVHAKLPLEREDH
jgi:signal transduction histidine kinase